MTICLWFDDQAEEAAQFYASIFADSKIGAISRFGKEGFEFHHKPEGSAMVVEFELNGMKFFALNGGTQFKFNESVSIVVYCDTQEEIDHYWSRLCEGGEESQCGWLKDKFGLSWQITPTVMTTYMSDPDPVRRDRAMAAMLTMRKFDLAAIKRAYEGKN
jgi:predicted 3-demethylubiquinone-9 3-methyltransferase (glyoxalase superfamily)